MNGIYPKIFKQAFYLTKNFRIFWKAGLFLVWPVFFLSLSVLSYVVLWARWDVAVQAQSQPWPEGNPWVGLVVLLFIALLAVYYFRYKAVVVLAVKELRTKTQVDRPKIYADSEPFVANSIKMGFAGFAVLGVLAVLLASPVYYLSSNGFADRAAVLGAFAIVVFLPIAALIYCLLLFAPMFMVSHNMPPRDSVRASVDVFRRNWLFLIVLWLVLLIVELIGLILSVGLMLVAMIPFVLLGQIFYDVGGAATTNALQALAGIAGFVVFFMSQAAIAAYLRVVWAMVFFEMVRPVKKMEELDTETVPEIAG